MNVRCGTLDAVLGRKAVRGDFTFLACAGAADGTTFEKSIGSKLPST